MQRQAIFEGIVGSVPLHCGKDSSQPNAQTREMMLSGQGVTAHQELQLMGGMGFLGCVMVSRPETPSSAGMLGGMLLHMPCGEFSSS